MASEEPCGTPETRNRRAEDRFCNVQPPRPKSVVLPLPGAGVSRQDYIDGFHTIGIDKSKIDCIQWTNTGVVCTMKKEKTSTEILETGVIQIAGRTLAVQDTKRSLMYVAVYDAPFELEDGALEKILSKYGQVKGIRRQWFKDSGIQTGIRTVRMRVDSPIPSYIRVGTMVISTKYTGQSKTCRKCDSPDHLARNCFVTRCNNCDQLDHKAFECKEALRCAICTDTDHLANVCPYNWVRDRQEEIESDDENEPTNPGRPSNERPAQTGLHFGGPSAGKEITIPSNFSFGRSQALTFAQACASPFLFSQPARTQGTQIDTGSPNTEDTAKNATRSLLQELEQTAKKNTGNEEKQNDMETDAKSICSKRTRTSSLSSDEEEHANDGSTGKSESTLEEPVTPKKLAGCDKATEVEKASEVEKQKEEPVQQQNGRHNMPKQTAPPQWQPPEQKKKKKETKAKKPKT